MTDSSRSDPLRVGVVSYLNARPLVAGLEQGLGAGRIELSTSVPSVLSDRMGAGELDIALLPVIELARIPGLEVLPGLGITTRGPSRSVLLVSRQPVERVESVGLDPESRTSNALVQVLFAEVWGRRPAFHTGSVDLEVTLASHDAAVRIGDKALFEAIPQGCHVYDLAEVWTASSGLPFVFAVWAARPGIVDHELYRLFHASRRRGTRMIEDIAASYTWNGRHDLDTARDYLTHHIHFRLGADEIRAMRTFFRATERLGLVEAAPEIRLALQRSTPCHEVAAQRGLIGGSTP